eukprot:GHRQ01032324.1.p1 GENE.GHRQ01032324.1~~GHRQ01032324.1.p1  ORF type:complete len:115 (-),score=30.51 GHRQ01032324.1:23-367(-)
MGLRSRLRASFNCDGLATSAARVICRAMQKYGLILADGGSPWFLTGEATPKWSKVIPDVTAFRADMKRIKGVDMEVVVPREGKDCTYSPWSSYAAAHYNSQQAAADNLLTSYLA